MKSRQAGAFAVGDRGSGGEIGDQQRQLDWGAMLQAQPAGGCRGVEHAPHALRDAAAVVVGLAHADARYASDIMGIARIDVGRPGLRQVQERVDGIAVMGAADIVEQHQQFVSRRRGGARPSGCGVARAEIGQDGRAEIITEAGDGPWRYRRSSYRRRPADR